MRFRVRGSGFRVRGLGGSLPGRPSAKPGRFVQSRTTYQSAVNGYYWAGKLRWYIWKLAFTLLSVVGNYEHADEWSLVYWLSTPHSLRVDVCVWGWVGDVVLFAHSS